MSDTQRITEFPFSEIANFNCDTQAEAQELIAQYLAAGGTGEALQQQLNEMLLDKTTDFAPLIFHDAFLPILREIPDFTQCCAPAVGHAVNHRARGVLRLVLDRGANRYARYNADAPLVLAAMDGDQDEAVGAAQILLDAGVDVDMTSNHGETALMYAAGNAHTELVQLLLAAGADVNRRDSLGRTPLHWALGQRAKVTGNVEVAKLLLQAGAGVDARDFDRNTPLHGLVSSCRLQSEDAGAAIDLLLHHGADVEARNDGELTPLVAAACDNKMGGFLVERLHQAGAEVEVLARGESMTDRLATESAMRVVRAVRMGKKLEGAMSIDDDRAPRAIGPSLGAL